MKRQRSEDQTVDYAERLSHYPHKGVCGLPELYDTRRALQSKLSRLVSLLDSAHKVVVLTGAGISTSAGIADFRGPDGVWTKEKLLKSSRTNLGHERANNTLRAVSTETEVSHNVVEHKRKKKSEFEAAVPTFTHHALTWLEKYGFVQYIVSQNVDGLHLRSGYPRERLAELHGNLFAERCGECKKEVLLDYDIGGVGLKPTGRKCESCGGAMHDTIVDWCDPLPEEEFAESQAQCKQADLILCLGTSLRIIPVAELPLLAKAFVVVNLQATPLDAQAALVIRGKVDDVMKYVLNHSKAKIAAASKCR